MNLEEIKYHVELRNKKIDVPFIEESGYKFCKEFTENNKCSNIYDFADINIYDAVTCIYYINKHENITIDEAKEFVNTFKYYFNTLDYTDLHSFMNVIIDISSKYKLEPIIDYLEEKNHIKAKKLLNSFRFISSDNNISQEEENRLNEEQREVLRTLKALQGRFDIARLFREIDKDDYLIYRIIDIICVHKHVNIIKEVFRRSHESTDPFEKINKKQMKEYIKNQYNTKGILSKIASIGAYVTEQTYEKNNHIQSVEKEIRNNEQAYEMVKDAATKEEITEARKIVKRIKDEELKHIFLKYIYEHNKKYYIELEKKLDNLRKNTTSAYLEELDKNGIVVDANEINKYMHNNIEDFKEMLSIIMSLSLDKIQILKILKCSNINKVKIIKNYVNEGYLSIAFIKNSIELFDINDNQLNVIEKNIQLLSNNEINPKLFINYPEILLCENNKVINNIKIINKYGYKDYIKNSNNYNFLLKENIEELIDKYIELGFGLFLEQDLDILNSENIKRIELLKSMNMPISSVDELKYYLTTDRFIINDTDLDSYIPNVLDYKDNKSLSLDINELEKYRIDKRTYSINGVLISINKVERLLEKGYNLSDAILYNMNLSEDEYKKLFGKIK